MSGRASGDDRRSRRRESRSRSRDRHHGRRGRSPSLAWDDRYRPRSRTRSRSRSRSRSRHRSRRDRSRSRSRGRGGSRSRSRGRGRGGSGGRSRSRDRHDVHNRYRSTFTSGGRVYEDNGGLPALEGHHNSDHPSGRLRQYADALSAGLDAALDRQPYGDGGSASRRPPPSNILCIRGLPEDAEEADLYKLFEPVPGVVAVRVVRERHTQKCRGFAYLELSTPEAAAALMDSDWRDQTYFGEHRLRFSFDSMGRPAGGSGASGAGGLGPGAVPSDWLCEFCKALNFGRRFECYQCSSARTPNAQRVSIEPDAPSYILRAAGLEPKTSEEALYYLFAPVAPVKEIRLVRDKYTGSPRGFAFVHFYTVADAAKALNALQNSPVAGQEPLLKLSFARDRFGQLPAAPGAAQGVLQTAGSDPMLGAGEVYSGWEPQSFEEGEGQQQGGGGDYAAWEPKAFEEEGEAAGAAQQEQQGGEAAAQAAAAAAWPAEQQQQQHNQQQQQQGGYVGDAAAMPAAAAMVPDGAGQPSWAGDTGAAGMPAGAAAAAGQAGDTEWVAAYHKEHPTEAATAAAAAAGGALHDPQQQQQQPQFSAACYAPDPPGYDPFTGGMEAAAGAGTNVQYAEQVQQAQQAGFEYDPETGYMKDPVSGYLYDANTGMYFHPQLRQWGSYDHSTQQFVPYEDPALAAAGSHAMHAAAAPGVSTAADSALGAANAALYMSKVAGPAAAAAQQQHFRHQAAVSAQRGQQRAGAAAGAGAASAQKRKGAVIGAAPKLDPQGLLEAAKAAEEKAQLLQKLKEQQEHRAAVAAAKQRAQQATAQQQRPPQQAQQAQQAVPTQAQAAGGGGVQGVIHRGKWARKG